MVLEGYERALLDSVAARGEALVTRAVEWAEVSSGSRNLPGLQRQLTLLEEAFSALPGRVERVRLTPSEDVDSEGGAVVQEHPDALRVVVRPQAPVQVALTGHYDTVYPEGTRFTGVSRREDGALNGPGLADMKGGISVMLGALEALEAHPAAGSLGYRVLLSPDEEIGSPASAAHLTELARDAQVGLTYEPALADGALASSRKGSGNFAVAVSGRSAHAGRDFAAGRNAVAAAARLAVALDSLNGARAGVTLNLARVDGGGPLNMVPAAAVLRFNVRVDDAVSAAWVEQAIDAQIAACATEGIGFRRHGGMTRAPKPVNAAQQRLFEEVRGLAGLIGVDLQWKPSGGVCEGNNLFAAGLPNLDTLGVRGGDIHSFDEHAWPDSFVERAQLSALILSRLASGAIDARGLRAAMGED